MKDDGIKFQWGDQYINADENVKGVGGKYWKWNEDGSITEYKPIELRMRGCAFGISDEGFRFEVKKPYSEFKFKTSDEAEKAAKYVNRNGYYAQRGIEAESKGKILKFNIINKHIMTATYFPAKGPDDE